MSGTQIFCLAVVTVSVFGAVAIAFADAWGRRHPRPPRIGDDSAKPDEPKL